MHRMATAGDFPVYPNRLGASQTDVDAGSSKDSLSCSLLERQSKGDIKTKESERITVVFTGMSTGLHPCSS